MIEEIDFETYIYISKDNFKIFVFDTKEQKNLYNADLKFYDKFNFQDLDNLSKFLDENIYKIEKLVGNFIENIFLLIENDENLNVDLSIKKKNYNKLINQKYLENTLIELKDLFKENYPEQIIMHMLIVNYIVDGKKYSSFNSDLNSDYLCLEVKFMTISNDLVYILDKILEKYQIKIKQYMCGDYIKKFFNESEYSDELSKMAYKLKNGLNNNEVILVSKNIENKGFFEKFFQLFS